MSKKREGETVKHVFSISPENLEAEFEEGTTYVTIRDFETEPPTEIKISFWELDELIAWRQRKGFGLCAEKPE